MSFEYHPAALAADATDYQANTLTRIKNAALYGGGASLISGALSIYNTVLDYAGKDQVDVADAVTRFGGDAMGDYYADNRNAIDIAGFVAGSVLPGSLGIKALKLARAGQATGNVAKFLNIPVSKKAHYLDAALQDMAQSGGVVKGLTTNRLKHITWETADQAMQGLAFEIAATATMHDSPIFDGDTAKDFGWNMLLGTALSGAIGGPLGALGAGGIIKGAQKEVQAAMRAADTISDPSKIGLLHGTEAYDIAESIIKLSDSAGDLKYSYKLDGKKVDTVLNTKEALAAAKASATRYGNDVLAMKFNEIATGDTAIGQAYFKFFQDSVVALKAAGKDPEEITQYVAGYLNNLKGVSHLDLDQIALDNRKFYVTTKPNGNTPMEKLANMFSPKRTKETGRQAYRLADDVTSEDITFAKLDDFNTTNLKQIFRDNPDVDVIHMPDGSVRVNPKSESVKRVREPRNSVRYMIDLETGSLTDEAAATIGDVLKKGTLNSTPDALWANGVKYAQVGKAFDTFGSPLESSARWVWASHLTEQQFRKITKGAIDAGDLPLLQRWDELMNSGATLNDVVIKSEGKSIDGFTINRAEFINSTRLYKLADTLENWTNGTVPNSRVLAAHLNTDVNWVETAIEQGFKQEYSAPVGKVFSTSEALNPRTVMATWEFDSAIRAIPEASYEMNMGPSHLMAKELTKQHQINIRTNVGKLAQQAALGADYGLFLKASPNLVSTASLSGAGARLFGASDAGYANNLARWAQDTGKNIALVSQKNKDATIEALSSYVNVLRGDPAASAELGAITTALRKSPTKYIFFDNKIISTEVKQLYDSISAAGGTVEDAIDELASSGIPHFFDVQSAAVYDFLKASSEINFKRQNKFISLYNAAGLTKEMLQEPVLYAPPINTVRYPFHAFVRTKEKVGLASDVTMITAKSEEQLRSLAASLTDDYDVFFKQDTERYFKIKGEYDYSHTLHEAAVNSALARKGKLADILPETRFENVMEDWLMWHGRQEEKLVRDAVQVGNRQIYGELQHLSTQYRTVAESLTRGLGAKFKSRVADPFGDYIKTSLNISKQAEFPLLDSLNDFVDKIGMMAGEAVNKAFKDANKGLISYEEANNILEGYGLGSPYKSVQQYMDANERYPKNIVKELLQKGNMLLATTTLRLDAANSLVNILSTPIMLGTEMASIRRMVGEGTPEAGALSELMSVKVPGRTQSVPSTVKLIGNAIKNYFGADKDALLTRYREIGAVKNINDQYHQMLDLAAYNPNVAPSKALENMKAAVDIGARITGNTFAEDFTRFVSADVMRQITEPLIASKRLTVQEQNAFMSTFVNRVQGNYITSQRPIVFQGTSGAAVSLFQTYAFNVLQQLHRHVQAGDKKTLAVFAGLQTTVFGLNGLPFFDAVNTHLVGSMVANNPQHKDMYSVLPAFNKELGDWMLYGTASAFPLFSGKAPALFTRGDLNPRHALILPTAIIDVPAVSASIKLVDTLTKMGSNLMSGADVTSTLLQGLEHQSLNRPLAGFAQLLAGQSTDSKGALISASIDLAETSRLGAMANRVFSAGGVAKMMGARPMEEAVALNAVYRNKQYEALDRDRIERLGQVVKTKLYNNEVPSEEELNDFMLRYTRSGGRVETFNQAMHRWSRDANVSIINQLANKASSPYANKLKSIMGGEDVQDYRNPGVGAQQ